MIGVLRPRPDVLSKSQRVDYMSRYCNLCGFISRRYGFKSRPLLVNDIATLWWLLDPTPTDKLPLSQLNCVRGTRQKLDAFVTHECQTLLAALSLSAVKAKLDDDLADEGKQNRSIINWLNRKSMRQCRDDLRQVHFDVEELERIVAAQVEVEQNRDLSFEQACEPTSELYGLLALEIASRCQSSFVASEARDMGRSLGRAVYLIDSIKDFEEDFGKCYNPLHRDAGVSCRLLPSELKHRVLEFVGSGLREFRCILEGELVTAWHAIERNLLAAVGVSDKRSVILYSGVCIPCGDGFVVLDKDDCQPSTCCCSAGCCFCIFTIGSQWLCSCFSSA